MIFFVRSPSEVLTAGRSQGRARPGWVRAAHVTPFPICNICFLFSRLDIFQFSVYVQSARRLNSAATSCSCAPSSPFFFDFCSDLKKKPTQQQPLRLKSLRKTLKQRVAVEHTAVIFLSSEASLPSKNRGEKTRANKRSRGKPSSFFFQVHSTQMWLVDVRSRRGCPLHPKLRG